ncbi:hypothetical protein V491_03041 [Pseudogymnoascus sp. VKM F-3775]|nr:hypothetical protein V491_03041 [Pseudogymnoascus sp. VKM F-3775]
METYVETRKGSPPYALAAIILVKVDTPPLLPKSPSAESPPPKNSTDAAVAILYESCSPHQEKRSILVDLGYALSLPTTGTALPDLLGYSIRISGAMSRRRSPAVELRTRGSGTFRGANGISILAPFFVSNALKFGEM